MGTTRAVLVGFAVVLFAILVIVGGQGPLIRAPKAFFAKRRETTFSTRNHMTEKGNKARLIGMIVGVVVLIAALLWKRLQH